MKIIYKININNVNTIFSHFLIIFNFNFNVIISLLLIDYIKFYFAKRDVKMFINIKNHKLRLIIDLNINSIINSNIKSIIDLNIKLTINLNINLTIDLNND